MKLNIPEQSRRQFITHTIPACSILCLGAGKALGFTPFGRENSQQGKHKFNENSNMTFKQVFDFTFRSNYIPFLYGVVQKMGEEEGLKFIKEISWARGERIGKSFAAQAPNNDLKTLTSPFRNNSYPLYKNTMTFDVVEDTETVVELKVTECLWAKAFNDVRAGKIGHEAVCIMDYAVAQSFNPKIKMERTKTLMQGNDCCNHRYIYTA